MKRFLMALIALYRFAISPALPQSCRFYPTCSQYAMHAIAKHGAWRGVVLAASRLLRCNPWNPGGVDLVP